MTNLLWPGDHRAGALMSDESLLGSMVAVESAWLSALAAAGIAPAACARADLSKLLAHHDGESLAIEAEGGGNPIIGLVELLRQRAAPAVAAWIHRGLTSQDVLDTSLMLGVRAVVEELVSQLRQQIVALTELATVHRGTPMVARTLTQHAAPTTFGAKAAGWLTGIVGHTTRTPITAAADAFVGCTDCWGQIAADVVTLARPEIGELSESTGANRGGSSSMPHKRNPVLSILIRRTALSAPPLAATLHTAAALANDERPDGAWHAEWDTLRILGRRTVVAGSQCGELVAGLTVHSERMSENLGATDILGEQRVIAELAGQPPSATYFGAVDRLIDESLDRARRVLGQRW
ncbi:MAG TPA: lyase family protein [Mycobacterium sp.]|nr:lyase family protein [Mycobacterium sp.]HTX95392.1 lyase family protein [Mycobacterium sp.]